MLMIDNTVAKLSLKAFVDFQMLIYILLPSKSPVFELSELRQIEFFLGAATMNGTTSAVTDATMPIR
jgi:hypothetical protein